MEMLAAVTFAVIMLYLFFWFTVRGVRKSTHAAHYMLGITEAVYEINKMIEEGIIPRESYIVKNKNVLFELIIYRGFDPWKDIFDSIKRAYRDGGGNDWLKLKKIKPEYRDDILRLEWKLIINYMKLRYNKYPFRCIVSVLGVACALILRKLIKRDAPKLSRESVKMEIINSALPVFLHA